MSDRLAVLPQYLIPKQALTELMGRLAGIEGGAKTTAVIRWFVRRYGVNMAEAANPDITSYRTFNEFFTRPLREGIRPIADAAYVSPVDGVVSQCGPVSGECIIQAKGHDYTVAALLGGDVALAGRFRNGQFATIYLSPRDYHRIHMPCAGRLRRMVYVPGDLFSVNPLTARTVPGLFARNERVVCIFEGDAGPFALVLVGATIVGSMATVWHGVVNPPRREAPREWTYLDGEVVLEKGQEMGRFLLGSTVVAVFPENTLSLADGWRAERPVCLGEPMGHALDH